MKYRKNIAISVRIIAGLMLLLAVSDLSYSYYQVLRVVICGSAIFLIWYFNSIKQGAIGWSFIVPALLFNPFLPVYLDKQIWQALDVVFSLQFFLALGADENMKINWSDEVGKDGFSGLFAYLLLSVVIGLAWYALPAIWNN